MYVSPRAQSVDRAGAAQIPGKVVPESKQSGVSQRVGKGTEEQEAATPERTEPRLQTSMGGFNLDKILRVFNSESHLNSLWLFHSTVTFQNVCPLLPINIHL